MVEKGNGTKYEQLLLSSQDVLCLNLIKPKRTPLRLLVPTTTDNCYILIFFCSYFHH